MIRLFEILTWAGAIFAFLISVGSMSGSAPQQAAAVAFALSLVIIPYCVLGMLQRRELMKLLAERA